MLGNQTVVTSPDAGIVMYTMDGYEGKTVDNLKKKRFRAEILYRKKFDFNRSKRRYTRL